MPVYNAIAGDWLERFHKGDRAILESCYEDHFQAVDHVIGSILGPVDKEMVLQEVFLKILSDAHIRKNFMGGSFHAWIVTLARNRAIDYLRHQKRERNIQAHYVATLKSEAHPPVHNEVEAKLLIDRFRSEHLPTKLRPVFELRFIEQLDQYEAAKQLNMGRTTLAYQERRVRNMLRAFLLKLEKVTS